jgi:LacI family transcriptional regulator
MDQEKPVKLSDISKALNLSVSTISRALNDSYEIGEETKKLVQSYALKVNYRPNLIAQSLKEMNTRYIAIIVPEIANSFFAEIVNVGMTADFNVVPCLDDVDAVVHV